MISPLQAKLARIALGMSQQDVADHFDKSHSFISQLENGISDPQVSNMQKLQAFYESQGMEFLDGDGLRRSKQQIQRFEGVQGFKAFMDDVYETACRHGGDICLFNTQPALWHRHLGVEWYDMHNRRMQALGDRIRVRIALREGDRAFILECATYRWIPEVHWATSMYYAYGSKLAILTFEGDQIHITVFDQAELASSFRVLFDIAWQYVTLPVSGGEGA